MKTKYKIIYWVFFILFLSISSYFIYFQYRKLNSTLIQINSELETQKQALLQLQKPKYSDQALSDAAIESLILRIEKISNEIENLPTITTQAKQPETVVKVENKSATLWERFLVAVLQTLKESIIIRKHTFPLEPLLSEDQQAYLVQNIRSQLAQASWAVLHSQPIIYEHAILQAITWIKQYYREDLEPVQQVLKELDLLEKTDIKGTSIH